MSGVVQPDDEQLPRSIAGEAGDEDRLIASYDEQNRGDLTVLKGVSGDGHGWLMIDDLVDTGKTAKAARDLVPEAHFATVYAKPAGRPIVDSFVTEVSQDTWILFPWDTEPQSVPPIIRARSA